MDIARLLEKNKFYGEKLDLQLFCELGEADG
jgi:hypothetical protein